MNDTEIGNSFYEYQKALGELLVAVRDLKRQTSRTHKSIEKIIDHPHLGAMLSLTKHTALLDKVDL